MSYTVDYRELDALLTSIQSAASSWSSGVSSVMDAEAAIAASTNISGNSANRMRAYLNAAYSCAQSSLSILLNLFCQNFLLYAQAYRDQVDAAGDTHIDEAELSQRRADLQTDRGELQQIGSAAESAIHEVSDLVSLPSLDIGEADAELGRILTSIDELDSDINALESEHSAKADEINALIDKLRAYFLELGEQSKESKASFTTEGFQSFASLPALISTSLTAYEQLQSQESAAISAMESWNERIEQEQAELAKRQEDAKWVTAGFNIFVSAVSAVATTVATAALTTVVGPVVAYSVSSIVVGAASGAIKGAFSAAANQYVVNGWDMEQWNVNRIAIHGCIGGVTGMTGGLLPPGTGDCAKAGISALSGAIEGITSTSYDQIADTGHITDVGEIAEDAIIKGGSSFVGSFLGNKASDWLGSRVESDLGVNYLTEGGVNHLSTVLQVEVASKLGSGMVNRFALTTLEKTGEVMFSQARGESPGEGYGVKDILNEGAKSAFDLSSLVEDAGEAATSKPVMTELTKDAWDNWNSKGYDGMMDKLAEMDARENPEEYAIFGDSLNPSDKESTLGDFGGATSAGGEVQRVQESDGNFTDWAHTANTNDELQQIREMEESGELESWQASTGSTEPKYPTMNLPSENKGTFLGEAGNSEFVPSDEGVLEKIKEYGVESVTYKNKQVDFSPFTHQETPWGDVDAEVEIAHMTGSREDPSLGVRREIGSAFDAINEPGNYHQADVELCNKILEANPNADVTPAKIEKYRKANNLTWHEGTDGVTMQLVPTEINSYFSHTGGASIKGYTQEIASMD